MYCLLVGLFAHREITVRDIPKILSEATIASGMVLFVIAAASVFGYYMTLERIPATIATYFTGITTSPLAMLLIINLFLLIVGMFLESVAALIILTPILVPVVTHLGIDPIHFGLIFILNMSVGALHPPVGGLMFITCSILNVRVVDYFWAVLPLLCAQLVVLLLITVFPPVVTFLPTLMMGPGR